MAEANSGRFKPGQSGNPGGRPAKKVKVIRDGVEVEMTVQALAIEQTEMAISTLVDIASDGRNPAAARVSAASTLLDRGWGKPAQPVTGDPDEPLVVAGVTLADVMAARAKVVDEC